MRILIGVVCAPSLAMGSITPAGVTVVDMPALNVLTVAPAESTQSTVFGTSALGELTGSRDSSLGEVTVANASLTPSVHIAWVITVNAGVYHYMYTISGPTGSGLGVSHFALGLSSDCVANGTCVTNAVVNSLPVESTLTYGANSASNGDTNFPGSFYGVRFFPGSSTQLSIVVQFDSDHPPVYRDFYVKLGQGGPPANTNGDSFWNHGSDPPSDTSTLITDFIAAPDGGAIPEPASFVLIGTGLAGFALLRRRRRH